MRGIEQRIQVYNIMINIIINNKCVLDKVIVS